MDQNRNAKDGASGGETGGVADAGGAGQGAIQENRLGTRNPADNLTQDDRVRGGRRSASTQIRDSSGQFAGRTKGSGGHVNGGKEQSGSANARNDVQGRASAEDGVGVGGKGDQSGRQTGGRTGDSVGSGGQGRVTNGNR